MTVKMCNNKSQLQMHLGQPAANDKQHCGEDKMFLRAHQQQRRCAGGTLFFGMWGSLCVLLLGERLWMAALGIVQNKAQSEPQQAALEKQQH